MLNHIFSDENAYTYSIYMEEHTNDNRLKSGTPELASNQSHTEVMFFILYLSQTKKEKKS